MLLVTRSSSAPSQRRQRQYSGHARVFTLTGGVWVQVGADIDGETAGDESGLSVAMNAVGDTVIIGARYNDGNGIIRVMLGCSR